MTTGESHKYFPKGLMSHISIDSSAFYRNLWTFFEQELALGWHKIPKDGISALESLANYQKKLAQPELADIPLYLFENPPISEHLE